MLLVPLPEVMVIPAGSIQLYVLPTTLLVEKVAELLFGQMADGPVTGLGVAGNAPKTVIVLAVPFTAQLVLLADTLMFD
jgi:hypothetical protein